MFTESFAIIKGNGKQLDVLKLKMGKELLLDLTVCCQLIIKINELVSYEPHYNTEHKQQVEKLYE